MQCRVQGWILSGGKIAIKDSCIRLFCCCVSIWWSHWVMFQVALVVKNLPASAWDVRDAGSTPGLGRSPGEGHGSPLQYSFPREAHGQRSLTGYTVHRDVKSQPDWSTLAHTDVHNVREFEDMHSSEERVIISATYSQEVPGKKCTHYTYKGRMCSRMLTVWYISNIFYGDTVFYNFPWWLRW